MWRCMHRAVRLSLVAGMLACSEATTAPSPAAANLFGGIVSDPVLPASGMVPVIGAAGRSARVDGIDGAAFVSLSPGAQPQGTSAAIVNLRTHDSVSTPMTQGGFDPVPLPAISGDTLEISVRGTLGAPRAARAVVPRRQAPRVVRTNPAKGRIDVAINASIAVVFTEPVDPTTVDSLSFRLLRNGSAVPGTIRPLAGSAVGIEFLPDHALEPLTGYELVLTQGIEDLTGEPLESPGQIDFVTASATLTPPPPLQGTWEFQSTAPTWRWYAAGAALNGELYIVGGRDDGSFWDYGGESPIGIVEAFDPRTRHVTVRAPMPTPRYGLGVGVVNGVLYAIGGSNGSDVLATVEAFDPATNTWTARAPLSEPRMDFGTAVVGGTLYAIGGWGHGGALASVEAYDPATDTWRSRQALPQPRMRVGAGALNGLVYATAGTEAATFTTRTQVYNPQTNAWADVASVAILRESPGLAAVNGLLYVVGGYESTVEVYDPAANAWGAAPQFPEALAGPTVVGAVDGALFVVRGGYNVGDESYIYRYTP